MPKQPHKNTGRIENLTRKGMGRPPGVLNKTSREVKAFATEVLESPAYVASLWRRIKNDELAPAIEALLYYYSFGKPKEHVEVSGDVTLIELVTASLQVRATGAPEETS